MEEGEDCWGDGREGVESRQRREDRHCDLACYAVVHVLVTEGKLLAWVAHDEDRDDGVLEGEEEVLAVG